MTPPACRPPGPICPDGAIRIAALLAVLACGPAAAVPSPEALPVLAAGAAAGPAAAGPARAATAPGPADAGAERVRRPAPGSVQHAVVSLGDGTTAVPVRPRPVVGGTAAVRTPGPVAAASSEARPVTRPAPVMSGWGVFGVLGLAFWIALRRSG